ncbi:dual specificity protein kinase splA isoform X2 [Culex pipiens pallens]|nr:dual specificity protein kinase splA isoform X2 [Culex pipiens pallens]
MINTKDEVVNWFKELKSYNRIDTMCTLLNMCLPFELRFLGTCLEELGRRDAQELRGIELRVNNPQEFISDIASCQTGEPTDRKHRRKMALFLALIRACNHTCVNELFRTLEGWGNRDFTRLFDEDVLQELLLVYTMATNHPVFSFEQRMKCGDIFNKLKNCELKPGPAGSGSPHQHHSDSANSTPPPQPQPTILAMPPQQLPQMPVVVPPQQQGAGVGAVPGPIPIPGFPQPALAQMIPADGSMPAHVTVEGLQQLQLIPQDFTMPPPSTVPHWPLRNTVFHQTSFPPPSSSSPHLSNPSSPIASRTASPTRILPTSSVQHRISRNQQATPVEQRSSHVGVGPQQDHRVMERGDSQQQQQQQSLKALDESMLLNVDQTTALTQLQQLRNGYRPSHNTLPRQSNKQSYVNQIQYHHQQQQQQQSGFHGTPSVGLGSLTHTLNNISLIDLTQKSSSDSGSSTGDISPPETPGLSAVPPPPNVVGGGGGLIRSRSSNLGRINGRPDKQQQQQQQQQQLGSSVIYTQTQQQQVSQQQQQVQSQQFVGGSNEIMVTSATQNLINSNNNTNTMNTSNGSNNSVVSGAVLIGPPTPTAGGANLVLSSQPQFTPAPYPPYHTAAHLAPTSRPTLIAAAPAGSAFRPPTVPAAYPPLQHNGEILYPYAGGPTIAFLTTAATAPPQNLQQTMRSAAQTTQPPPPPQQQQPPLIQPQQQQQKVPTAYTPPVAVVPPQHPSSAASTPTGGASSLYSPQSCFNCGSQKHTGLDCQESSMEDVTRNSIYKLDYNASLIASQQLAAAAAAAALSAAGGGPTQPIVAPSSSSSSSSPALGVVSSVGVVSPAALSASVSMSRMSLVDGKGDAAEVVVVPHSPSPVHHHSAATSSSSATTLPLATPSQLVDVATSVSTQTINNQTDSSSSSTISK